MSDNGDGTMVDFFGREVKVGDVIVFNEPYYKTLISNPVKKITPKGIKVGYETNYGAIKETFISQGQFVLSPNCE